MEYTYKMKNKKPIFKIFKEVDKENIIIRKKYGYYIEPSKKELRKVLGCSPDLADSFAIALYPKGSGYEPIEQKRINFIAKVRL